MMLKRLLDWFGQSSSGRFSFNWDDAMSVVRTVIQAGVVAALAELYRLIGPSVVDDSIERILAYVVLGALLQIAKKFLASNNGQ
ncbi:MAG: hypothetical protein KatS3mg087_1036 [Patescibacteria group bacterium]|nr:MAG: hypothetical protein KatS3mg087_1036 [Patescibacteria group bacterium]